jgi:hypothetical protein
VETAAGREGTSPVQGDEGLSAEEILEKLDGGQIAYKDAVRLLRARRRGEKHGNEE